MDKPVYVIGHKNPDADSICSAIAYSALKNKLGINTVAARLSAVNKETLYILDRFRLPVPMLLTSAKCTLAEIDMDEANFPAHYNDWYVPLIDEGKPMPDSIGADASA